MMVNIFWNLIFLVDLGGVIGLVLAALERWPGLAARLELLFYGAGCLFVVVLAMGFIFARLTERHYRPGVRVGQAGIIHTDWRDG